VTNFSMATTAHCFYCFDSILEEFGAPVKEPNFPNEEYPLFVTWNVVSGSDLRLRGCIGNFSPLQLHSGLKNYAKISAFKDSRFPPIERHEFERLQCSVSLLTEFEDGTDWQDWKVGTHGIRIRLETDQVYSATYLPEVAEKQQWTHQETIDSLLRKSGFRDRITSTTRDSIELVRYQSSKSHATYREYCK
jgi:AMME syndrome candidate gene 1 protein